jgi:hypothetical protein
MHLFHERKMIYWTLAATVAFFFFVLIIPMWGHWDPIRN